MTSESKDGVVDSRQAYSLKEFRRRAGLGDVAWRSVREKLKVRLVGGITRFHGQRLMIGNQISYHYHLELLEPRLMGRPPKQDPTDQQQQMEQLATANAQLERQVAAAKVKQEVAQILSLTAADQRLEKKNRRSARQQRKHRSPR